MIRLLIAPSQDVTLSSVSRCLAVAEKAVELGHEIAFMADEGTGHWIKPYYSSVFLCPSPPKINLACIGVMKIISVEDYVQFIGLNEVGFLEESLQRELYAIKAFRPDVILSDFRLTASISATLSNTPLACIAKWPLDPNNLENTHSAIYDSQLGSINNWLAHHRIPPISNIAELCHRRSDLRIIPSIPELELFPDPNNFHHVGYLISKKLEYGSFYVKKWNNFQKRLYVYLSNSNLNDAEVHSLFQNAFAGTDIGVLISIGRIPIEPSENLPIGNDNVEFIWHCPGCSALSASHAFLYHGGQNSTIAAMLIGIPALAIPFDSAERRYNAEQLTKYGAGVLLEWENITPENLKSTVKEVMCSKRFLENMKGLSARIRSFGGPKKAVQLLEQLAFHKRALR